MTQVVRITPTSVSNHSNIRYIGDIGSGEMILDRPNRLDGGAGTCVPETAVRLTQFIKKGWAEHLSIIVEATDKKSIFSNCKNSEKIKKMKKQFKKTAKHHRRNQGGALRNLAELEWIRHCLIYNAKTQQYIDTSNGRVMILSKENYEQKYKDTDCYVIKKKINPKIADEDFNTILDGMIDVINDTFREINNKVYYNEYCF